MQLLLSFFIWSKHQIKKKLFLKNQTCARTVRKLFSKTGPSITQHFEKFYCKCFFAFLYSASFYGSTPNDYATTLTNANTNGLGFSFHHVELFCSSQHIILWHGRELFSKQSLPFSKWDRVTALNQGLLSERFVFEISTYKYMHIHSLEIQ